MRPLPTRREFLSGGLGLGALALGGLLAPGAMARGTSGPHHVPRAKRVIQLFMAGAPSQFELFEDKPTLRRLDGQAPPPSLVAGQRFAFIDPNRARLLGPRRRFERHGECGAAVSELRRVGDRWMSVGLPARPPLDTIISVYTTEFERDDR